MLLARTTRNYPGRMKTSCEQETSINLRDVCVQQQKRDNPRLPARTVASLGSLRMIAVEHRARIYAEAAAAGRRWAAATLVCVILLSTRISPRSRWFFFVLFKFLENLCFSYM